MGVEWPTRVSSSLSSRESIGDPPCRPAGRSAVLGGSLSLGATRGTARREGLMAERLFGARVRRREDARLVTGHGRYVADVALPGLLHVAVHRSPHAHARIVRVDPDEARRRPGVVHVLVPADVVALGRLPLLVPHASLVAPACPG